MYGLIEPMIQYLMIFLKAASVAKLEKLTQMAKTYEKKIKKNFDQIVFNPFVSGPFSGETFPSFNTICM